MKPTPLNEAADAEMNGAAAWYEQRRIGLGERFLTEVESALVRVGSHPEQFPVLEGDVRRCLVSGFPYGIIYQPREDHILVLAVMHLHRDPDYWRGRL